MINIDTHTALPIFVQDVPEDDSEALSTVPLFVSAFSTCVLQTKHEIVCVGSVQFEMVSMQSEKSICAPPRLSEVSPTLPLKQLQCLSD